MSDPELTPPSWRERVTAASGVDWSPARLVALAALAIGLVVIGWALLRPTPAPPPPELSLPRAADTGASSTSTASTAATDVVVHAAGAVQVPGLYHLPSGARVADLVNAAGGLTGDADPSTINLAALLSDGERVYVTKVGELAPALPATPAGSTEGPGGTTPAGPVSLNRASATELEALPGVGPATAASIIAYRDEHGGFRRIDELLDVRGIGPARYEQLRSLVTL